MCEAYTTLTSGDWRM